jgi:hypothetical protein
MAVYKLSRQTFRFLIQRCTKYAVRNFRLSPKRECYCNEIANVTYIKVYVTFIPQSIERLAERCCIVWGNRHNTNIDIMLQQKRYHQYKILCVCSLYYYSRDMFPRVLLNLRPSIIIKSANSIALNVLNNCDLHLAFWIVCVVYRFYCSQ